MNEIKIDGLTLEELTALDLYEKKVRCRGRLIGHIVFLIIGTIIAISDGEYLTCLLSGVGISAYFMPCIRGYQIFHHKMGFGSMISVIFGFGVLFFLIGLISISPDFLRPILAIAPLILGAISIAADVRYMLKNK